MTDEKGNIRDDETDDAEVVTVTRIDSATKPSSYPVIVLGLAIIVLLALLLAMNLRNRDTPEEAAGPDLADLRAELDARRAELNRERMAMGLSPIQGASEPLDEIAARLKRDSETLVSLAGSFQQMLAEKDAEVSAKSSELLRSEKLRQSLAAENSRLQSEVRQVQAGDQEVELLRQGLAMGRERQARLEDDLNRARQELQALADGGPVEDRQVLQRQLEEALRAKDFFEKRVNELEGVQVPDDDGLIEVEE